MANNLREDNPYSTGFLINYDEGDFSLERSKIIYNPSTSDELHLLIYGDTLDGLANDKYGNSKYWWIIADINNIEHPLILTPNTNIIIPDITKIKAKL